MTPNVPITSDEIVEQVLEVAELIERILIIAKALDAYSN